METINRVIITCSECRTTANVKPTRSGAPRPPTGWKRLGDEIFCKACKAKRWRLRAVTFPVATVIGDDWKEFMTALKKSWERSTSLANWAVRQLLLADEDRKASDVKIPPLPKLDLYRKWTDTYYDRAAWSGAAQSANCLLHAMEAKWRKKRFQVMWLNSERVPRHTYAVPYPVHNAAWKAEFVETDGGAVPVVRVTLDGKKWTIKLRGGWDRSRQLKAFAQIASGEALRGELAIYRQRSFGSHRRTGSEKGLVQTRIMVKLVAHLPRPKIERKAFGQFEVRTGRSAVLVGIVPSWTRPWVYRAEMLRRTIHDYDAKRQRLAEDLKCERRPMNQVERDWLARAGLKMDRRVDYACRLMARLVVQFAARQGLAEVVWSDDDRRYFERFPWGKLTSCIAETCENEGLIFTDASGEVAESESQPASDGST